MIEDIKDHIVTFSYIIAEPFNVTSPGNFHSNIPDIRGNKSIKLQPLIQKYQ